MSPVADCDLKAFYDLAVADEAHLKTLRTFYGCLTAGLAYLHSLKIRHRDIKPQNILVKGERVYLADFGISLDWESLSRSTTTEESGKTLLYCAPEVTQFKPRNSSSDIWSLGCVFLEMASVLSGVDLQDMRNFFRRICGNYRFFSNITNIPDWIDILRPKSALEDQSPFGWISDMLQLDPADRPTALTLFDIISHLSSKRKMALPTSFCGICCEVDVSSEESGSDGDIWGQDHEGTVGNPDNYGTETQIRLELQSRVEALEEDVAERRRRQLEQTQRMQGSVNSL
jgi:serine/threonine protein kinase